MIATAHCPQLLGNGRLRPGMVGYGERPRGPVERPDHALYQRDP